MNYIKWINLFRGHKGNNLKVNRMILFFSFQSRPNPAIERKILSLKKYISLHIYYYYFSYAVFVQYSPPTKGHSSYQARLQIQRDSKILNHLLEERTPLLEDHFFITLGMTL